MQRRQDVHHQNHQPAPSSPLSTFMSEMLHTENFQIVEVIADASLTHISTTRRLETAIQRGGGRGDVHLPSFDESQSGNDSLIRSRECQCGRPLPFVGAVASTGAADTHAISRWKNGTDTPRAKTVKFQPVHRLPSFESLSPPCKQQSRRKPVFPKETWQKNTVVD